jgi:LuxR family maltose regulon positive regulatory protein
MTSRRASQTLRPDDILLSKLEIPLLGERIVQRERLTDLLNQAMQRRVTLVAAPTGYGKTTLLVEWLTTPGVNEWRTVWLSLDRYDQSLPGFWAYIVSGFKKVYPRLHFNIQQVINRGFDAEHLPVINPLLNEIAQLPYSFFVVLDDYQTITHAAVHASLDYFIDHQPANVHLVIASRATPPLALSRLRARRQLLEITASDLAFTLPEAKSFLSNVMAVEFDAEQAEALFTMTEGWIAGLQLAALSRRGQPAGQFTLAELSQDNRQILEYLTEEVLNHQDPRIKEFLLKTSLLSELCAPLCDALMEGSDSQDILTRIEQDNLFVACLDSSGYWFRYHAMFAEALTVQLKRSDPASVPELHRRAYRWLLDHNLPEKAVPHALAAGDLEKAAEIVDSCAMQAILQYDLVSLMQWLSYFNDDMVARRPRLGIYQAMLTFHNGQDQQTEEILDRASQYPLDDQDLFEFQWTVSAIRAAIECMIGDPRLGISLGQKLLSHPSAHRLNFRGFIYYVLGFAHVFLNEYAAAADDYEKACQVASDRKSIIEYVHTCGELARVLKKQGRLNQAEALYHQSIAAARRYEQPPELIALPESGLMEIALERGDLEAARAWEHAIRDCFPRLSQSIPMRNFLCQINMRLVFFDLASGDLAAACADFERALESIDTVLALFPNTTLDITNLLVHMLLALQGQETGEPWRKEAETWLAAAGDPRDVAGQAALARLALASQQVDSALQRLEPGIVAAQASGDVEHQIEIQTLLALAYQAQDRFDPALAALQAALSLAEPEDFVRPFIAGGLPMKALLERFLSGEAAQPQGPRGERIHRLIETILAAMNTAAVAPRPMANLPHTQPPALPEATELTPQMPPLSPREQEVLELLAAGKSVKEIAAALTISVNTAKVHVKNIYRKLGSHSRKVVFDRAAALGIAAKK